MVMELRKRKAPGQGAALNGATNVVTADKSVSATATAKKQRKTRKAPATAEARPKSSTTMTAPAASPAPKVGEKVNLEAFGGTIKKNDGTEVTLKALVEESENGVIIFTYPKASTPGCTNQACLFRDSYSQLTDAGFAVYGLSADSTNANTNFQTKQKLPYPLLCDQEQTLIAALGLKKSPKGTTRGVFIIDKKTTEVLLLKPGSPAGTLSDAKKVIATRREGSSKL